MAKRSGRKKSTRKKRNPSRKSSDGKTDEELPAAVAALIDDPEAALGVLNEVRSFINSLVMKGLERVGESVISVISELVLKAKSAKLANIADSLDYLSVIVRGYFDKSPSFDIAAYRFSLNKLMNCYFLTEKMLKEKRSVIAGYGPQTIIGRLRSVYIPVTGKMHLYSIGMNGWNSLNGSLTGITGYYFDLNSGKILTLSVVYPSQYVNSDPVELYYRPIKGHDFSPSDIAHGTFIFENIKLNHEGKISLGKDLKVTAVPHIFLPENKYFNGIRFADWNDLLYALSDNASIPPGIRKTEHNFFVVEPVSWGRFKFDPITQLFTAELGDGGNRVIKMVLTNQPENKRIVESLNKIYKLKPLPDGLFGEILIRRRTIEIKPISVLYYNGIELSIYGETTLYGELHPGLDAIPKSKE